MATTALFDYMLARKQLSHALQKNVQDVSSDCLQTEYAQLPGSDAEKKLAMDQAFRDVLFKYVVNDEDCEKLKIILSVAVEAVKKELCSASTPFIMLSDLLDGIVIDKCAQVFTYVEDNVATWKSETFHTAGKNYLLRMCNDLLRRLSKSQDTLFCGRIQLFLARLFPLWEKSGLNLMSQFNLENVTYFSTKQEDTEIIRKMSMESEKGDDGMDVEEGEMNDKNTNTIPVDYNLYKKFWSLQDYFRKPNQCYEKIPWKTFVNYTDEVLTCFDSFKLDDPKQSRKRKEQIQAQGHSHAYFAKYLTSEKLLDLQLNDSNFRRYVLVQFLILFQYLKATTKFKGTNLVMNEEQTSWVNTTYDKVMALIKETPPEGEKFAQAIEHILSRDQYWSSWKNEGCPSYIKSDDKEPTPETEQKTTKRVPKKRSIGEDLKATDGKIIKMGSNELTYLWNICPDNMAACKSGDGVGLPVLDEFFCEAIEQADPEQMIEDQYKLIHEENWSWKALRLLARRSQHFFTPTNAGKSLAEYLETMIGNLVKEKPGGATPNQPEGEARHEHADQEEIHDQQEENTLDKDKTDTPPPTVIKDKGEAFLTKEQLVSLSKSLGTRWKQLATELRFPEDDIEYFESETTDLAAQALKMLTIWVENEPERATVSAMSAALKEVGLANTATNLFGKV